MSLTTLLTILLTTIPLNSVGNPVKKPPRPMNYYPDRGDIVCVNGNNRSFGMVGNGNLSTPPRFARRDTKEDDATTPSATKPGARLPCR